jgi:hypothetical protein
LRAIELSERPGEVSTRPGDPPPAVVVAWLAEQALHYTRFDGNEWLSPRSLDLPSNAASQLRLVALDAHQALVAVHLVSGGEQRVVTLGLCE